MFVDRASETKAINSAIDLALNTFITGPADSVQTPAGCFRSSGCAPEEAGAAYYETNLAPLRRFLGLVIPNTVSTTSAWPPSG